MKFLFVLLCCIACDSCYSQAKYTIVAGSKIDSMYCVEHCPFFDFHTLEEIHGSTMPDHMISVKNGKIEQLQTSTKQVLESTFGHSSQGTPVSINIVVDSVGVARGAIVNAANNSNGLPELAARVAFDYLKTVEFLPATLHGKPIASVIPVFFRIDENKKDNGAISKTEMAWSYESMPSFDHDFKQDKLLNFVKDNLKQFDTLENEAIVYVQFEVDTMGFTHNHKVIRGIDEQLNAEALRVCHLIKFDNPAMQRGEPASIIYTLPIKFEPQKTPALKDKKSCRWKKRECR